MMSNSIALAPEALPPGLLRTELPTIVRERCETNDQMAIWLAIRWLLAECGGRTRAISSRMLAPIAKCSIETVQKHLAPVRRNISGPATLVELDLIEVVGYEDNGGRNRTPIYAIPASVELDNAAYTLTFVQRRARSLPLMQAKALQQLPILTLLDRKDDQEVDRLSDQLLSLDRKDDQEVDRKDDQGESFRALVSANAATGLCGIVTPQTSLIEEGVDRLSDQGVDRKDDRVRKEGMLKEDEGHARTRAEAHFGERLPTPQPPTGQQLVSRHPQALWDVAWCDAHGQMAPAMQHEQIVNLIAEWDTRSEGFGAYWVARAILEASYDPEPPGSLRLVRWVLRSWAASPPEEWGAPPARGRGSALAHTQPPHPSGAGTARSDGARAADAGARRRGSVPSERAAVHARAPQAPGRVRTLGEDDDA